jgi:hypothetical protein
MLVGDERRMWYRDDPNVTIPWSNNVVVNNDSIYLTWSTHINIYNMDLILERSVQNSFAIADSKVVEPKVSKTSKTSKTPCKSYQVETKNAFASLPVELECPKLEPIDPRIFGFSKMELPRDFVTVSTSNQIVDVTTSAPYVYRMGGMKITKSTLADNVYAGHDFMSFAYQNTTEYHKFGEEPKIHNCPHNVHYGPRVGFVMNTSTSKEKRFSGPRLGDGTAILVFSSCNHNGRRTVRYEKWEDKNISK